MHRSSENVAAIATALAKAQTELSNPEKSMIGTVYNTRSDSPQSFRYASLSSGLDIIRKALGGHQIAITQTTDIDSSVAGQAFQTAYAGVSSKTFGTLTFGRQLTPLADGVTKYDPNYGATAFGLIGASNTYSGAGSNEDNRFDSTAKYEVSFDDLVHFGALYKFNGATGSANSAYQFDLGGEYAAASVDAFYSKVYSAISNAPLSAAQVQDLTTVGNPAFGLPVSKSLAATVSDTTTFAVMERLPSSRAIERASPTRPALLAA